MFVFEMVWSCGKKHYDRLVKKIYMNEVEGNNDRKTAGILREEKEKNTSGRGFKKV